MADVGSAGPAARGFTTVTIAHITFSLTYRHHDRAVAAVRRMDISIEEAAMDLGSQAVAGAEGRDAADHRARPSCRAGCWPSPSHSTMWSSPASQPGPGAHDAADPDLVQGQARRDPWISTHWPRSSSSWSASASAYRAYIMHRMETKRERDTQLGHQGERVRYAGPTLVERRGLPSGELCSKRRSMRTCRTHPLRCGHVFLSARHDQRACLEVYRTCARLDHEDPVPFLKSVGLVREVEALKSTVRKEAQ